MASGSSAKFLSWRDSVAPVLPYWDGKLTVGRTDELSCLSPPTILWVYPARKVSAGLGEASTHRDVNA